MDVCVCMCKGNKNISPTRTNPFPRSQNKLTMHLSYYSAPIFQFHNTESQTACLLHFGWHNRCIHMAASSQLGTTHPEKAPKLLSQTACKSALKWEQARARLLPVCLPAASLKKYGFMKFVTITREGKEAVTGWYTVWLCCFVTAKCCSDQNSPLWACVCMQRKNSCVCERQKERHCLKPRAVVHSDLPRLSVYTHTHTCRPPDSAPSGILIHFILPQWDADSIPAPRPLIIMI